MIKLSKRSAAASGFTIVELLIVIVVIGILGAITVVAYNGIRDRAQNTQFLSAIDAYEKLLKMYKADHGHYPATIIYDQNYNAGFPFGDNPGYACLGEEYPANERFNKDSCYKYDYSIGGSMVNADIAVKLPSLNSALKQYSPKLPSLQYEPSTIDNSANNPAFEYFNIDIRGIIYAGIEYSEYPDNNQNQLIYIIDSEQECGRGVKQVEESDGKRYTFCITELN